MSNCEMIEISMPRNLTISAILWRDIACKRVEVGKRLVKTVHL